MEYTQFASRIHQAYPAMPERVIEIAWATRPWWVDAQEHVDEWVINVAHFSDSLCSPEKAQWPMPDVTSAEWLDICKRIWNDAELVTVQRNFLYAAYLAALNTHPRLTPKIAETLIQAIHIVMLSVQRLRITGIPFNLGIDMGEIDRPVSGMMPPNKEIGS